MIAYREDVPIYLRDVAVIQMDTLPKRQIQRAGGFEGVQLMVRKQPGYNTVEVNQRVKDEIRRLRSVLPPSLTVEVQTDQSENVLDSIGGVGQAAWQGGLLAILVHFSF